MPSFSKEVNIDEYVDVDIYIDIYDFYIEMDDNEKKEMLKYLIKDGFGSDINSPSGRSSWEFDGAILKLKKNYLSLSNEETDLIIKISKRF
jgi:hypothetical protein